MCPFANVQICQCNTQITQSVSIIIKISKQKKLLIIKYKIIN